MKSIGFTGTRNGLSVEQYKVLSIVLKEKRKEGYNIFRHGDCIGADSQSDSLARLYEYLIYIHPPIISTLRANLKGDMIYPIKTYLERNKDIVDKSDVIIATPGESIKKSRSGTWFTIRYAVSNCKELIIILPNGGIENGRK